MTTNFVLIPTSVNTVYEFGFLSSYMRTALFMLSFKYISLFLLDLVWLGIAYLSGFHTPYFIIIKKKKAIKRFLKIIYKHTRVPLTQHPSSSLHNALQNVSFRRLTRVKNVRRGLEWFEEGERTSYPYNDDGGMECQ